MNIGASDSIEPQCGQAGVEGLQGGWSLGMLEKPRGVQKLVLCHSQPRLEVFVESVSLKTLN